MIFAPFIIAAQASAIAAKAMAARNAERAKLGLPPIEPTKLSPEETARLEKLSKEGDFLMITWLIFGGILFTVPWAAFIYCVIKIAFARQGIPWP